MTDTLKIYCGAMDIGGTRVRAALFGPDGELTGEITDMTTPVELEPEGFVAALADIFLDVLKNNGCEPDSIDGLGLGVPSTVDYSRGLLDPSPNLPKIENYPLAQQLSSRLGLPVAMENDANCFALGEASHGAVAGCESCCGVTLGTGLGLGVVLGGRLLRGAHGCAGEIWHAPYGDGILEDRVSGRALERQYKIKTGADVSGEEIHQRAVAGEPAAREVLSAMGEALGHGLAYLVNVLDPETIVIGGSVARAWEFFAGPMQQVVDKHRIARNRTRIVPAELGDRAVLYGAVALLEKHI